MTSPTSLQDPEAFFTTAPWTIGVVGLGYVGLPLLVAASERGLGAVGYDISDDRVSEIVAGHSPVGDVTDGALSSMLARGAVVSGDAAVLSQADAIMICVPSPLGSSRQPDLSHIESAVAAVQGIARPGQLICLESTTYPGYTDDLVVPAVKAAGLRLDHDVWVAFSPERLSPGGDLELSGIPKVVGGVTPTSTAVAAAAYRRLVARVHTVSSARVAEMSKLLENTYRAVNIALANEMARIAHGLGIDVWEVIEAAATKPFGFQPFWPGPGVGGHCIPLDPQYLAWRAREANVATRMIDLADQVNSTMPAYAASRIADLLDQDGPGVRGARILAVGISYKPNVADARESAALDVIADLTDRGAEVSVLDPVAGREAIVAHGLAPAAPGDDLAGYAMAVVLTDHDGVDYAAVAAAVPRVFDTRGVYRRLGLSHDNVTTL